MNHKKRVKKKHTTFKKKNRVNFSEGDRNKLSINTAIKNVQREKQTKSIRRRKSKEGAYLKRGGEARVAEDVARTKRLIASR